MVHRRAFDRFEPLYHRRSWSYLAIWTKLFLSSSLYYWDHGHGIIADSFVSMEFCCFWNALWKHGKRFLFFWQWYFYSLLTESVQDSLIEATTPKSRVNLDVQRIPEGIVALWLRTGNSCGPSLLLYIDLFWKKRNPPPPRHTFTWLP